ncbi:MAG: glycosyltransferase [Anaerolineae bacterium]
MHSDELKVLVVSRLYPRPSNPVLGVFVEEEVKDLSKHCQIKVVSPIPWFPPLKRFRKWYPYAQVPAREIREGIEVFRPRAIVFPRNFLFALLGFSFYLSLRRCVSEIEREFPFDLIHAHTAYPDGFSAAMLGRALKRPVVITIHGGDVSLYFRRHLGRKLGLWALADADRVIVVSNALRTEVVERYGAQDDKVTVIPNGVDVTRFAPMPRGEARAIFEKKITIYGGEQCRPFIHVDDVADAIIGCLEAPLAVVSGQVFNVGSDAGNCRLIQIGDIIKRVVPDVEVSVQQNAEDERNYRVSSESIRRMVGFSANKTVEDAVLDIVGAVRTGRIVNYRDPRYSNVKWLTENGETAITMVPNIYSVVMRMPEGMSATG